MMDGIPQGGVRFRHRGSPVVVRVVVPLANATDDRLAFKLSLALYELK